MYTKCSRPRIRLPCPLLNSYRLLPDYSNLSSLLGLDTRFEVPAKACDGETCKQQGKLRPPLPGDFSMGELQAPATCKDAMHDSY